MGMSTHIVGFRAPDEEWQRKKKAFDACREAKIEPPDELWDFFAGEEPDNAGIEIKLDCIQTCEDSYNIWEINVKDIPQQCTTIRFINSY